MLKSCEGSTGDLFVASGQGEQHYSLTAAVEEQQLPKATIAFYTPGAPRTTFVQGVIKRYAPGPRHAAKGIIRPTIWSGPPASGTRWIASC